MFPAIYFLNYCSYYFEVLTNANTQKSSEASTNTDKRKWWLKTNFKIAEYNNKKAYARYPPANKKTN